MKGTYDTMHIIIVLICTLKNRKDPRFIKKKYEENGCSIQKLWTCSELRILRNKYCHRRHFS